MSLQDILGMTETIHVMDIGASCIAEVPVYKKLLDENLAHLNAFEGDSRQIQKIHETYGHKVSIFNDFLSDGTEKTLYLASEASGMTSLLKPNLAALKFFNGFEQFGKIYMTEKIQTRRLDEVTGIPAIDLVKMDIQGSELSVLENGLNTLKDCLAIQLEVSYICLYENQPSFGEIDVWMRRNGFAPHCFLDVKRWSIAPTIKDNNFRVPFNQLLESDIVYIKDPLRFTELTSEQLKKMALIAHYCFSSFDLCVHVLMELNSRGSLTSDAPQQYLAQLNPKSEPSQ
jgi:FkbM family methyltransferase